MAAPQEHGEKTDFLLVVLFLWVGGALVEFHCSGTLDGLGAFPHTSALEGTTESKHRKWKAFNS